jgi:hypothetical protein
MTKCGIAGEQLLASALLASKSTSWMFLPSLVCLLLATSALQWLFCFWALPQCKDLGQHDDTTNASPGSLNMASSRPAAATASKLHGSTGMPGQGKEARVVNKEGALREA